jgi:hypothetical protein
MNIEASIQLQQIKQDLLTAIQAGGPGSGRHPGAGTQVAKHFTDNGFKRTSTGKWDMAGPAPNYKHPDGHLAHVGSRGDWMVKNSSGRIRMGNPGDNAGLALGHLRDLGIAEQQKANIKSCNKK